MAGQVLLSGWRVRLADENNQPLYPGRVRFFDATTDTPKSVFEGYLSETPLGTIVATDQEGYLPVIWLDYGLYKCRVDRQISIDPEDWEELWMLNDVGIAAEDTGAPGSGVLAYCRNIAEMKAIPAGTVDAVWVAGYYEPQDTNAPMFFTFEVDSTETDDGGAFIIPNDTPSGTAGRYHQVFNDLGNIDVTSFGAIADGQTDCVGPIINCQNYCKRGDIFARAPKIVFSAGGESTYDISGPVTLDGEITDNPGTQETSKLTYAIQTGVRFGYGTSAAEINFVNKVDIDTYEPLIESGVNMTFAQGSTPFVRPDWYVDGLYPEKMVEAGQNTDIPLHIDHPDDIDWTDIDDHSLEVGADVVIFPGTRIAPPDTYSIKFLGDVESILADDPIFCNEDLLGAVTIPDGFVIVDSQPKLRASWFGYGHIVGDQGPALDYAFNAYVNSSTALNNQKPTLIIPEIDHDLSVSSNVFGSTLPCDFEGILRVTNDAVVTGISVLNESATWKFDLELGCRVFVTNDAMKPEWFGVNTGTYSEHWRYLTTAIESASASNCPLDGGGASYDITEAVTPAPSRMTGNLTIRNMSVRSTGSWEAFQMFNISMEPSDPHDIILENFNVIFGNSSLDKVGIIASSWYMRITNCSFQNRTAFFGSDVIVKGCQFYGNADDPSRHFPGVDCKGMIFEGNTFINTKFYITGQTAANAGESFPMLKNVIISNNVFNNAGGEEEQGCITIEGRVANTLVSGLHIHNNQFSGAVYGAGDSEGRAKRHRIRNKLQSGASWLNRDMSDSAGEPYYKIEHCMCITDNRASMLFDTNSSGAGGNQETTREQYVPSTVGHVKFSQNVNSPGSGYAPLGFGTKVSSQFAIDTTIDTEVMFVLEGDTYSRFKEYKVMDCYIGTFIEGYGTQYFPAPVSAAIPNYSTVEEIDNGGFNAIRGPMFTNSDPNNPPQINEGFLRGTIFFKLYDPI